MASLHKNRRTTLERIEKFVSRLYFTDVNLYGRIYPTQEPVGMIVAATVTYLLLYLLLKIILIARCITLGLTCRKALEINSLHRNN